MHTIVRLIKICHGLFKGGGYNYFIGSNTSFVHTLFHILGVEF